LPSFCKERDARKRSALMIPKFTISYFSLTNQKEQKRGLRFF
jgi:hypothetical protein